MKLLNERTQINDAITGWVKTYGLDKTYGADNRGRLVGTELLKLNRDTCTVETVNEIIGNDYWVHKRTCGECNEKTWNVVQIGEEPDFDSRTAYVCRQCLISALEFFE